MDKILIAVTSTAEFPASAGMQAGRSTGFYMDEMAIPYYAMTAAGYTVDFASPLGGPPPVDPGSLGEVGNRKAAVQRFLDDAPAMAALNASQALSQVDPAEYAGVFLPGGHGTMWDFRQSPVLAGLIGRIWDRGGVVGAVCHGPAGLIEAASSDGTPIVQGRRVNAFTDAEERAVGLAETVPFLLETELRAKGALFEGSANFQPHAVRDGRLVTGQNPASAPGVAELMVAALQDATREQTALAG